MVAAEDLPTQLLPLCQGPAPQDFQTRASPTPNMQTEAQVVRVTGVGEADSRGRQLGAVGEWREGTCGRRHV